MTVTSLLLDTLRFEIGQRNTDSLAKEEEEVVEREERREGNWERRRKRSKIKSNGGDRVDEKLVVKMKIESKDEEMEEIT